MILFIYYIKNDIIIYYLLCVVLLVFIIMIINDTILNDTLEIMKKLQHIIREVKKDINYSYGLSFYNNKINIILKKNGQINIFSNRCIRKYSIIDWTFKI